MYFFRVGPDNGRGFIERFLIQIAKRSAMAVIDLCEVPQKIRAAAAGADHAVLDLVVLRMRSDDRRAACFAAVVTPAAAMPAAPASLNTSRRDKSSFCAMDFLFFSGCSEIQLKHSVYVIVSCAAMLTVAAALV